MSWGEGWRGEGGAVQIFNYNKTYQLLSAVIVGVVYFTLSLFSSLFLSLPPSSSLQLSFSRSVYVCVMLNYQML